MSFFLVIKAYYLTLNMYLFGLMFYDKQMAKQGMLRVPEKRLWKYAWLGGALGGFVGMKTVRHKTQHPTFALGFPALAVGQGILMIYLSILF